MFLPQAHHSEDEQYLEVFPCFPMPKLLITYFNINNGTLKRRKNIPDNSEFRIFLANGSTVGPLHTRCSVDSQKLSSKAFSLEISTSHLDSSSHEEYELRNHFPETIFLEQVYVSSDYVSYFYLFQGNKNTVSLHDDFRLSFGKRESKS